MDRDANAGAQPFGSQRLAQRKKMLLGKQLYLHEKFCLKRKHLITFQDLKHKCLESNLEVIEKSGTDLFGYFTTHRFFVCLRVG